MSVLVLNLGLKSMRAAVFDDAGRRLAISHRPITTEMGEGRVEQNPEEWWRAALSTMGEALADCDLARSVDIVTVTASAGCVVAMRADGSTLGNAIMISDVRAAEQAQRIEESTAFRELALGRRRVTADLSLAKIIWMLDNEPDRFHGSAWFASPNDFLLHRLTGEVVIDSDNASKYLFDSRTGTYPRSLLSEFGIGLDQLPQVVQPGAHSIPVRAEIRERFGLAPHVTAVVTTYDAICAVYGTGVAEAGDACDVSGTVTSFRVVTDRASIGEASGLFVSPHFADGRFLAGGSNNLGGGVVEWAKQLLYLGDPDPYATMAEEAREAPPGAAGITFLPYLLGERAPLWDSHARAVVFGLARNHQRGDIIRAIFEGIGYSVMDIAERLRDADVFINWVSVSGGLARLGPISQIKADMLGIPVRSTEESESSALGAALLALVCTGRFGSLHEAIRACVRFNTQYEPDDSRTAMYADFYGIYTALYTQLRNLFRERERLIGLHRETLRTEPTYTENL